MSKAVVNVEAVDHEENMMVAHCSTSLASLLMRCAGVGSSRCLYYNQSFLTHPL